MTGKNRLLRLDLHCHLDGSLSQGCIEELLGRSVKLEELQADMDCQSLAEYLEKFEIPLECLQTEKGLERAGYDFMKNAALDHVSYIEARFAPLLSTQEGLSTERILEAVLKGMEQGKTEFGIDYGVIVCAMRHESEGANRRMLKAAREFLGNGVCAADLAGNEAAFPMSLFMELFGEVRRLEMPFTIHAGECGSVQNILDAVQCGASRIGHGIALRGQKEAIAFCRDRQIGIEMCPLSNMQTKAVKDPAEYPIQEFLNANLLVTVNTDNRTVSQTTLEKEFAFIRERYAVTREQEVQMTKNAIEVAFASDAVKERLWKKMYTFEK